MSSFKLEREMLKLELQQLQLQQVQHILEDLTDAEFRVYKSLIKFTRENKYSPVLTEIADSLGITRQAVSLHVLKLEKKGYIKRIGRGRIIITYKDAEIAIENVDKLRPILEKLKKLYESGLITEEEYALKKKQVLNI